MKQIFGSISGRVYFCVVVALMVAPIVIAIAEQSFYLDLLTRILILTIAVASLNLIVGYGGMISLGHAAYLGIGAYCVGIPSYYEIYNGYLHLGLAIVCSAAFCTDYRRDLFTHAWAIFYFDYIGVYANAVFHLCQHRRIRCR